jgi:pimeloyl-ACP methyl ester carboxylesterase
VAKATFKNRMSASLRLCAGFAAAAVASGLTPVSRSAEIAIVKNIVLVHGANNDGSAWRGVYDILTKDGYRVSVVQQPLTGLADDVAATKRVIDQQEGPVILVGHSYGGAIITVAGADPKVRALVYVAAVQPDVGESTNKLAASMPGRASSSDFKPTKDGFIFIDPAKFAADVGADLPPAQAQFMANSQMPVAAAAFDAPVTVAAWRDKPSYGIVATADHALNPKLAHWMYERSGAEVVEIEASHLVYISHPYEVARVIERAARAIAVNTTNANEGVRPAVPLAADRRIHK